MKILDISVGLPREVQYRGKPVMTSIFKRPVPGPVYLGFDNLDGDRQSDLRFHGGRDKAVYAYPQEHYAWWQNAWNGKLTEPAQFGENLTVDGADEKSVVIGSRFAVGNAVVVVTQPRVPCYKLGIRCGDADMTRLFWEAGRLGWYLRVEKEGLIDRGQAFELLHQPGHGITVHELWEAVTEKSPKIARRALQQLDHVDTGWIRRLQTVAR